MISVHATALSGLNTAQKRLEVSAHNVAQAATPAPRRLVLQPNTRPDGGVSAEVRVAGETSAGHADLATDLVEQRLALYSFEANLRSVRTADAMLGALIDVKA